MHRKINILGITTIFFVTVTLFIVGFKVRNNEKPVNVYQVYLSGKKIGVIKNKNELLTLIDNRQQAIKAEYNVDKVYPPDSLETISYTTYNKTVKSAQEIYDLIEKESTFTIKGYTISIKKDDNTAKYINILNKDDLEPALKNAVRAFIPADKLEAFINNTQVEITDTGEIIKNVYFEETITIKENYLNVSDEIITSEEDLTRFLLFGTLEKQKQYTVRDGDTVETVAYNNRLNAQELLIANPNLSSVNSLLSKGQLLNIGLIAPLFTIIEEVELTEDVTLKYETKYEYNSSLYPSESYTKQEGKNGVSRLTEQIQYKNGEIMVLVVSKSTELTASIDKVVVKGTKTDNYYGQYDPPSPIGTDWTWPTVRPYVITSYYGYRWGKLHAGLDISGTGFGSPIYSSTDGVVVKAYKSCSNVGSYGNQCGGSYGNYVTIQTDSNYRIIYAHMKSNVPVNIGDTVSKGQVIGYMGSSGSSTGTHLHYQINDLNGNTYDPCKLAFKC